MSVIEWRYLAFDQLTASELYAVLQLRSEVFVVEQACIFQDMDGTDPQAMHLLGSMSSGLVAYARCFRAGIKFPEASIGRVVTRTAARGNGAGHATMKKAIACLTQERGLQAIRIGAQAHLADFYSRHGFEKSGQVYLEDGIDHIEMLRLPHELRSCR
ncbi:MAG: GCN5-related N-acetyltransferase [Polaromonas sp.]|jgi:ElaA protein|nr:GCN5-related N-acetyltransferase [Polaromonas sp.]